MATVVRNTDPNLQMVVDAHNDLKKQIGAGAFFHLDASERTISSPNSTDLATALALVNEIRTIYEFHRADTLAHKVTDAANAVAAPKAVDLATAQTLANEIKADYEAHRPSTTYHYTADATNAIAAANATDQTTLNTLLNELKTDFNLHMASAPTAKSLRLVGA